MDKSIVAYMIVGLLLVGAGIGLLIVDEEESFREPLTQENYKAMVLSKIVPIGYGQPMENDIDTELNLQGQDERVYRLYESKNFPTEGQLFVNRIA